MSSARIVTFAIGFGLLGACAGYASAQTETATPLPPKRPPAVQQQADAPAAAQPGAPVEAGMAQAAPAIKPPPGISGPPQVVALGRQPYNPAAVTPEQAAAIKRINTYLNSVRVMSGTFTQVGPDGTRDQGQFWVSKPGKLRFQYAAPSPVELVADGRSVAVRNRKLNTQDLYFIGQTPLRFLLADRIDLIQDTAVVGLYGDKDTITVTLEEKSSVGGSARIALMFSAKDAALRQWTVTDAQGYDTTVAIYDVDTKSVPNNKLFFINEVRTL